MCECGSVCVCLFCMCVLCLVHMCLTCVYYVFVSARLYMFNDRENHIVDVFSCVFNVCVSECLVHMLFDVHSI